jgi:deoxyribose-phosphate aldolase
MNPVLAKISAVVDLTLLDLIATSEQLQALSQEADQFKVASICVYPQHLQQLSTVLPIPRAAVVNFPTGKETASATVGTIEWIARAKAAQEIDYVFPYDQYLNGEEASALKHCQHIIEVCKAHQLKIKVILETEVYPSMQTIHALCLKLIALDCDFLKTSTGTKPMGATMEAVEAILAAIGSAKQPCGVKVSGGVRTPSQAMTYIKLAESMMQKPVDASWFRIGSSKLLN